MTKFEQTFSNFKNALARLEESITEYDENPDFSLSIRDGAIHRFEFTTDLAVKSVREYLLSELVFDIDTPKAVMREAFRRESSMMRAVGCKF